MNKLRIYIPLTTGDTIALTIVAETTNSTTLFAYDAAISKETGEAPYQILEGCGYEYEIESGYSLEEIKGVVSRSNLNKSCGRITPNIYVGTLDIKIVKCATTEEVGTFAIEVQSVKTDYRTDYRTMLEEITEKCTDLLLQHSSPVTQNLTTNFDFKSITPYQQFAFIKSVLESDDFSNAVHKVLSAPVTKWKESEKEKDIRSIKRVNNKVIRQFAGASNRIALPENHPLRHNTSLTSVPTKVNTNNKIETVDTPENRFIKFALDFFLSFCGDFRNKLKDDGRTKREAAQLEEKLEQFLSHSVFKEISTPSSLWLNSPVLQRKEGYREILKAWLMFDLAAKLIWTGGEDVYGGGKRDVAVLYEYWLFFKLLDVIKEVFKIDPQSLQNLMEPSSDKLGLKLKQGQYLPVSGVYTGSSRKLNVEFSYNKTFSGLKVYPEGGSWTRDLRPDYTLSVWPFGIDSKQAEEEELIVHIHFDAKYKIENLLSLFDASDNLSDEKEEEKKGNYKRADLLKMHTYRDAIRRTAGAYILYPGTEPTQIRGFHELLPGLGAFAISPSKSNNGTEQLTAFLNEVVEHFLNRASQREKMSLKTYQTHRDTDVDVVNESLPETYGINRALIPDETFVLVCFYKDQKHLDWIIRNSLYNARTGSNRGSLRLSPQETGAKYLLLHTTGETRTGRIFKLGSKGPRVFSKQDMLKKAYPDPSQDFYLVYDIAEGIETEFDRVRWNITSLEKYSDARGSALPFAVSMTELMAAIVSVR